MANNTLNSLSPTLLKVLEVAKLNKAVTPTEINNHVGNGNYAAKHVLYLRILGYDFAVTKDGRNVASYTLIKEPANAAQLVADATAKMNKTPAAKAPKAKVAKVKAAKVVKAKPAVSTKTEAEVAAIKAKNLAKLKEVGANRAKAAKRVREYDDVTEQFGTTGEVGTSFNVDGDWDSVEGLDLKTLL
jgi:hypothetical protein